MIRLEADDPEVRSRTVAALRAAAGRDPDLKIHCRECGSLLAHGLEVPGHGVLFASFWNVDDEYRGTVNDVELTGKRAREAEREGWMLFRAMMGAPGAPTLRGRPIDGTERHGALGLLTLAAELTQDYPDLMVRCAKHGDDVLPRDTVVRWVTTREHHKVRNEKVPLAGRELEYRQPDRGEWLAEFTRTHTSREYLD